MARQKRISTTQLRSTPPAGVPSAGPALWVPITTFAPEPYEPRRQMLAVIQQDDHGYTASFFDANIHASGDNEEEALRNLKALILDVFESLSAEPAERLGPEPWRQLAVLREFIARRE